MFSRALFKQSCKANKTMWFIITVAVCFMLACVMLISGNGKLNKARYGIQDTIIESQLDNNVTKNALEYYSVEQANLSYFVKRYVARNDLEKALSDTLYNIFGKYNSSTMELASTEFNLFALSIHTGMGEEREQALYEKMALLGFDVTPFDYVSASAMSESERAEYYQEFAKNRMCAIIAVNFIGQETVDKIVASLSDYKVTVEKYASYSYVNEQGESVSKYTGVSGAKYIYDLSYESMLSFIAKVDYRVASGTSREVAVKDVSEELTATFLSSLSEEVGVAIQEVGELDLYGLIVGNVFFKMAGLLLPIIYMIMVANNLIAGQVDSGSMAYILSTSTKRKQVVFTQAVFLVLSLFVMFVCTTATSMVCLYIVKRPTIFLTYWQLLCLNVGAFLSMAAMSGISFCASCWFNRGKYSLALGGGLNMFFLVSTMLGLFGAKVLPSLIRLEALNYFNYFSLITLFDSVAILNGSLAFLWKFALLVVIGIGFYIAGALKFIKKDLPL